MKFIKIFAEIIASVYAVLFIGGFLNYFPQSLLENCDKMPYREGLAAETRAIM